MPMIDVYAAAGLFEDKRAGTTPRASSRATSRRR
jgi:hypothetical protein